LYTITHEYIKRNGKERREKNWKSAPALRLAAAKKRTMTRWYSSGNRLMTYLGSTVKVLFSKTLKKVADNAILIKENIEKKSRK
jgi:hypothetical protein